MRRKKPIKKGVAAVPVIMQMEAMECGAASLCMILAYYGRWVPISEMRDLVGVSRDGAKMYTLAKVAESMGLSTAGYTGELIFTRLRIPASFIGNSPTIWLFAARSAIK